MAAGSSHTASRTSPPRRRPAAAKSSWPLASEVRTASISAILRGASAVMGTTRVLIFSRNGERILDFRSTLRLYNKDGYANFLRSSVEIS